jgi:ATP-binding cassette subfamily C protein CydD
VGERTALATDRIEALDGYFARWLPAAALALLGPLLVAAAAATVELRAGLLLLGAGLLVPVAQAFTGIGAAAASRRQFDALSRLSGRFLDRMRGLPVIVLFNREEAEAEALGAAADELRQRTMRVLRVAFLASVALELLSALALALLAWRGQGSLFPLLLVPAFFAPLRGFSAAYHEAMSARGAAAALAPLLAAPEPERLLLHEVPPHVVLSAEGLTLRYDPYRPPALEGVSFRVNAGEALVQPVLDLLLDPEIGRRGDQPRHIVALRGEERRQRAAARPAEQPHPRRLGPRLFRVDHAIDQSDDLGCKAPVGPVERAAGRQRIGGEILAGPADIELARRWVLHRELQHDRLLRRRIRR